MFRPSRLSTIAFVLLALPLPAVQAQTSSSSSPSQIGIQSGDVPDFAPTDNPNLSIQDPHDMGFAQAFIQCAGNTPLLNQFDTGPAATASQTYDLGPTSSGGRSEDAATAVFTDGQTADAFSAYSALAGAAFPRCLISTLDSFDSQQGISHPPTTVTDLPTPQYGDGDTGFVIMASFTPTDNTWTDVTVVHRGPIVAVLLTFSYQAPFPDSLRRSILANIAKRMGAAPSAPATTLPSSGSGPCVAPSSLFETPLLDEDDVSSTLGGAFSYSGWSDNQSVMPGVNGRQCTWTGPQIPSYSPPVSIGKTELAGVSLLVSEPLSAPEAKADYQSDLNAFYPSSVPEPNNTIPGLGDDAFFVNQDGEFGVDVLSGNRLFQVQIPAYYTETKDIALARLVLTRLRTTGHSPAATGRFSNPDCGVQLKLGVTTDKTDVLNQQLSKFSASHLPISAAMVALPAGLAMTLAPSLEPKDFVFCSNGLAATATHLPPWSDPGSTLGVKAGPQSNFGPFVYSSELASWTQLDKNTPPHQEFTTRFDPTLEFSQSLNIDISKYGLNASLTLGRIVLASATVALELLDSNNQVFTVKLGPQLDLDLDVSKKALVDKVAEDLAGGQSEQTAESDIAKQVATDDAAAVEADVEGFFGMTPAQIEAQIERQIDPELFSEFHSWLSALTADPAAAGELSNQGVTPNELPAEDAAAFADASAGDTIVEKGVCDIIFGGPEDPLGDLICLA